MRSNFFLFIAIVFAILFLIDLYSFRGIKSVSANLSNRIQSLLTIVFWVVPGIVLLGVIILGFIQEKIQTPEYFYRSNQFFGFIILFYIPKLFFILFVLLQDLFGGIAFISGSENKLTSFFSKIYQTAVWAKIGLIPFSLLFFMILHGIFFGRFNYQVRDLTLTFDNLPEEFDGFRIAQISDVHIGSFWSNTDKFQKGIDLLQQQNADLIVFTGDMVNNYADEMLPFIDILKKLNAPFGKLAILGNHDYGEYNQWENKYEKQKDHLKLIEYYKNTGFNLLLNKAQIITKNSEKIAVIGIENWGLPPFPQHGDFEKAYNEAGDIDFKILLSHDPSHWDEQVKNKSDVKLTLSGHTHAMQFTFRLFGFKWSPVSWKYPKWEGLYQENGQMLYVNIGFGFIGFPGRVGTPPEITIFKLKKQK